MEQKQNSMPMVIAVVAIVLIIAVVGIILLMRNNNAPATTATTNTTNTTDNMVIDNTTATTTTTTTNTTTTSGNETLNLNIANMQFPATAMAKVGQKVTWTNQDSFTHTVTIKSLGIDSGAISNGQQFSQTFTTPGTYEVTCDFHPTMKETLTVQ